jgi:hypothetical protein
MLLGLFIGALRWACCELMKLDNRVQGTVSAVELTTLKLTIWLLVARWSWHASWNWNKAVTRTIMTE